MYIEHLSEKLNKYNPKSDNFFYKTLNKCCIKMHIFLDCKVSFFYFYEFNIELMLTGVQDAFLTTSLYFYHYH